MNHDALTLYKLVILYFLEKSDFPVTNAQVSDYLLNHGFEDYFNIQTAISSLEEDGHIRKSQKINRSFLTITNAGKQMIQLIGKQLSAPIRKEIEQYIKENHYSLKKENSCMMDYQKEKNGTYSVTLSLVEQNTTIFSVTVQVLNEAMAMEFCEHWPENHADIYEMVMKTLIGHI